MHPDWIHRPDGARTVAPRWSCSRPAIGTAWVTVPSPLILPANSTTTRTIRMADVTMRADTKQLAGTKADVTYLLGSWVNAKRETDHIARIEVAERDGEVVIRPYGMAPESAEPIDWGEAVATPYVASGSTEVAGFHAHYEQGAVTTRIAANVKLGVLVLQTYTSFRDDSGRLSHYAREFFHHPHAEPTEGALAPGSLAGEWINTDPTTEWITEFTLVENEDGSATVRVTTATEPYDWGEVEARLYRDNLGKPGFHAVYELAEFQAVLAANSNQDLIIVAAFVNPKGSGRPAFYRDFYYRR
jgi:hypothetical protein